MPPSRFARTSIALASLVVSTACGAPTPPANDTPAVPSTAVVDEPIQPLPDLPALDARRVALGAQLFTDERLSVDSAISCATCHPLDHGGADGRAHSSSAGGHTTSVNTPTVFNVAYNYRYNWNGAYPSLEAELDAPVRRAMGTDWPDLVARLRHTANYAALFAARYPDGLTEANVRDALATFERSLVTPNSRFDRWLRGDRTALSADAVEGYALFKNYGCASCHQGANAGGNMFQVMGVMGDYFAARGGPATPGDNGLASATHDPRDRHVFRVPSLRNVAVTAPYFHDGSTATLEQAINVMARYQLGRPMAPDQVAHIAAFLRALTGEYHGRPVGS
jgi:cytochrome c peroxidase